MSRPGLEQRSTGVFDSYEELEKKVIEMTEEGFNKSQIARAVGISRASMYRMDLRLASEKAKPKVVETEREKARKKVDNLWRIANV